MGILKLMHMKEAKRSNKAQRLLNTLNYVFNPGKTEENLYVGGLHCPCFSAQAAYTKMINTKQIFTKTTGRQGYHFILSFSEREHVSPELCQEITQEIIERLFDDYETVFAVHTDRKHMHSHIVFNSVSYRDGHKYHYADGDWAKEYMPVINEICRKHGLEELQINNEIDETRTVNMRQNLTHSEREDRKKRRYTELEHIQADIDRAIENASSYEEFLNILRSMGYKLRDGAEHHAHLSLIPPESDREKFMRTDRLGDAYIPAGIRKRISGEWQIPSYTPDCLDEEEGELFMRSQHETSPMPKRNKDKYIIYTIRMRRVVGIRIINKDGSRNKLSYFQRCYLRYFRYFSGMSHTPDAMNWKYSEDIIRAQKMYKLVLKMLEHGIRTKADADRMPDRGEGKRIKEEIDRTYPHVMAWNEGRKETKTKHLG